jgi:hypothetical protein
MRIVKVACLAIVSAAALGLTAFAARPAKKPKKALRVVVVPALAPNGPVPTPALAGAQAAWGGVAQKAQAQFASERLGQKVEVDPAAAGPMLAAQKEVAAAFEILEPTADRLRHFAWVANEPLVPEGGILGWRGSVQSSMRTPAGWRFEINFWPTFGGGGVTHTPDHYVETWDYDGAGPRYVGGTGPVGKGGIFRD